MAGVDSGFVLVLFAPNVNPPPVDDAAGVALLSVVADGFALSSPAVDAPNVKPPVAGVSGVALLAAVVAGGLVLRTLGLTKRESSSSLWPVSLE